MISLGKKELLPFLYSPTSGKPSFVRKSSNGKTIQEISVFCQHPIFPSPPSENGKTPTEEDNYRFFATNG
jgi:hypothetical protein